MSSPAASRISALVASRRSARLSRIGRADIIRSIEQHSVLVKGPRGAGSEAIQARNPRWHLETPHRTTRQPPVDLRTEPALRATDSATRRGSLPARQVFGNYP